MKKSHVALVIVSVAAGIIVGFCGFLWCMCRALKDFDFGDIEFEEDNVEPEIVED